MRGEIRRYLELVKPSNDWPLRATLIFQRDESDRRLVHRQADPLVHGISFEQRLR